MARQVRIEFPGAMYHVMARGNRRGPIVKDDKDREMFLRTVGEASERAGFRVHAYVLMTNHYHLLLETPRANLSQGMGWLQNAYTRRVNVRHRQWGRLFGDRYKSILVEPGNCFWALMDYIHLNPVRAGLVGGAEGLESYPWSSVKNYLSLPKRRPEWFETAMGMSVSGCEDSARGRREYLEVLERRVDWKHPRKAGTIYSEGEGKPELAVHSALRRGWFFGSQEFREKLLKLAAGKLGERAEKKSDGYHGADLHDHAEYRAKEILRAGFKYFGISQRELRGVRKKDPRKGVLAELVQAETTMSLDWISKELGMGTRSWCCQQIRGTRANYKKRRGRNRELQIARAEIKNTIINDFNSSIRTNSRPIVSAGEDQGSHGHLGKMSLPVISFPSSVG